MKFVNTFLALIAFYFANAQSIDPLPVIATDPTYDLTPNIMTSTHINNYIDISMDTRGLSKIIQIAPVVIESSDINWPNGSWGRGLFSDKYLTAVSDMTSGEFEVFNAWKNNLYSKVNDCEQPILDENGNWSAASDGSRYVGTRWYQGTHPFTHLSSKMMRAHMHVANLYGQNGGTGNSVDNYNVVKDGLDYLISIQREEDGAYNTWFFRPSKDMPNITHDAFPVIENDLASACGNQNSTHSYQTSYALRALSQGYHFLQSNGISCDKMTKLEDAINAAAGSLLAQIDLSRSGAYGEDAYDCWISNSNYKGLVAWGLASAYKATGNCEYLDGAMWVCNKLFIQNHSGGIADGMWETPYIDPGDTDGCGDTIYHDTIIYYHMLTLRGLIETFDALPTTSDFYYYKAYLKANIVKGVNHVINKRLIYYPTSGVQTGYYKKTYLNTDGVVCAMPQIYHFYTEDIIEPIATLNVYARDVARHGSYFSEIEKTNLKNMLIVMGKPNVYLAWSHFPTVATYADYLDATLDFDSGATTTIRRIFPRPGDCSEADIVSGGRSFPNGLPNCLPILIDSDGSGVTSLCPVSRQHNNEITDLIEPLQIDVTNIIHIKIFDIRGYKIYEDSKIESVKINLNTLQLDSGIYIVKLKNSEGEITTKKVYIK